MVQLKKIDDLSKEHIIPEDKCFRFRYVSEDAAARIRDDLYCDQHGKIVLHRTRTPTKNATFPTFIESTGKND